MTLHNAVLSSQEFLRLRNGDKRVFRKVYDAYLGLVQYVVLRCGIDETECRDIVQDTFLRLYRKAGEIQNKDSVKSWLLVCARNLALDHRRKQLRQNTESVADIPESGQGLWSDAVDSSQRELELQLIGNLLTQIQAESGDATLAMFYGEGLSIKEIAEKLGEPASSTTSRLCRLRRKYQQRFEEHLEALRASYL